MKYFDNTEWWNRVSWFYQL